MTPSHRSGGRLGAAERARLLHLIGLAEDTPAARVKWRDLLDSAGVSLTPLLLRGIDAGRAGDDVPVWAVSRLRAERMALAAAFVRRHAALKAACDALWRADVPALVLKGAALAYQVYPDPTLRPMVDVDLWLPPDRLDHAAQALALVGFGYSAELKASLPASKAPDQGLERTMLHPDVTLELHGSLRSLHGTSWDSFERVWHSSEPVSLGGISAQVLGPDHLLTHLGLHVARTHAYSSTLLPLVDIALVTQRWQDHWDWARLIHAWRQEGVLNWMLLSITLARDLLGAPVPQDLEARVELPPQWPTIRSVATDRLWEARLHRLPPALGTAVQMGAPGSRRRWLGERVFDYYWRSPEPITAAARVAGAARRLWHDLSVKAPKYVRGWWDGSLRGPKLARGIALARSRAELERLVMAAGDLGYAATPGATRPADVSPAIAAPPAPR